MEFLEIYKKVYYLNIALLDFIRKLKFDCCKWLVLKDALLILTLYIVLCYVLTTKQQNLSMSTSCFYWNQQTETINNCLCPAGNTN